MTRRFIALVLLCSLSSSIAALESPSLEIRIGFTDRFRSGAWTPVFVVLRPGERPLEGTLTLENRRGTSFSEKGRTLLEKDIVYSDRELRIFRFVLPLHSGAYPLTARLRQGDTIVAESSAPIRMKGTRDPLTVVISRKPSLDFLLPLLRNRFEGRAEVVYPHPEFLPRDWMGWDGASLAVIHDIPPDSMGFLEAEALSQWVRRGGVLVVIGGPWSVGRAWHSDAPPGAVGVPIRLETGDNTLTAFPPVSSVDQRADFPLALRYEWGEGSIWYHSVDSSRLTGESRDLRERMWVPIFRDLGDRSMVEPMLELTAAETVADVLSEDPAPIYPASPTTLGLVALYGILVSGVVLVGRRKEKEKRRTALRIAAVGVLGVLATAAASVGLYQGAARPDVLFRRIVIHRNLPSGSSLETHRVTLVTSTAETVDIAIPGKKARFPGGAETDLRASFRNDGTVLNGLVVEPWSARSQVFVTDAAPYLGVLTETKDSSGGTTVVVENVGEQTIRDIVLVHGGQVYRPRESSADAFLLLPGDTAVFPGLRPLPSSPSVLEKGWEEDLKIADRVRTEMIRQLVEQTVDPAEPTLIGWFEPRRSEVLTRRSWRSREEIGFVLVRAPVLDPGVGGPR